MHISLFRVTSWFDTVCNIVTLWVNPARIQEFLPRGGGGSRPQCQKTALTTSNLFYSFTVVYQWFISKKTIIFKGCRGGPTFSRGYPSFSRGGGVQLFPFLLICIETHRTCDFPGEGGGSGPPVPLWTRTR